MKYPSALISQLLFSSLTLLSGTAAFAQDGSAHPMTFSTPPSFKCDANIPWDSVSSWHGKGGYCGEGLLYTVVGKVPGVSEGYIKAKIVVPEDRNSEWPTYNGEVHEIHNNFFEVQFCITTRTSNRPIWFQAYGLDRKKYGERCNVTLVGIQLED